MIATAMLLPDYTLECQHCELPVWESETRRLSRDENEWECKGCRRMSYFRYVPDHDSS